MKTLKNRTRTVSVFGVCLIAMVTANAADTTEQALLNCAQMQNNALRLACFDQVAQSEQQAAPSTPIAQALEPPASVVPVTAPPVDKRTDDTEANVRDVLIVKLDKNAYGKWLFYFDTGEVWKQSGSGKIRLIESAPIAAQLSKGMLGNQKLHLAQRRQPIKVKEVESASEVLPNGNSVVTEAPRDEDQPLQVINLKKNPLGRWLFYLNNGEVWKQVDSKKLRLSVTPPVSVQVSKGILGNTRLHIDGRRQLIKVTLIRSDK